MTFASTRSRKLPKVLLSLVLPSVGLAAFGSANAATFYVRTDGGDATQCNGRADAKYPGSGTAQACAWKNPNIALPNSGSARIAGGDTLMIGAGTYQIGSGGYMQKVPSGPSTTSRTKILGKAGTKLVGVAGTHRVLNLEGSSNVEIGNLEITDNSDCVFNHSNAAAKCSTSMPWARVGVYAAASSNVWMHDVNVHGMAKNAFNAGGLANWTLERVKMNKNGSAGWDGNVSSGSGSNSGQMVMRDIEIGWNGCGERVATGEVWACWAQSTGGYGDGFGTVDTGGQWLIEDAYIHHNTSDGLDLRYMDGADTTKVTLRRIHSVANAGNQVKVKGNALIENSVMVGHCTYFRGKYFMATGDLCRAYGSSVLLILTGNDVATVRHNTIAGEGDAQIAYGEGASSDKIYIQNNVVVGFPYYASTSQQTLMTAGGAPGAKSLSGNMGWKVRTCPTGTTCSADPKLTAQTSLAAFDAEPLSTSPVINKVPVISGLTTDFVGAPRPSGSANDVGAYELQAGGGGSTPTPSPTCTRAKPTLNITGPATAVAAGTTNTYSVTLKNNDSSGCSNTSFALAKSVSSGLTSSLSTSAIALAPGATGNATIVVKSPTNAVAGTYPIGVGTSSAAGSIHTANDSATYWVAAASTAGLTEVVRTDKTVYLAGSKVWMSARVLKDGKPVAGVPVQFTALKPNGINKVYLSGTTDYQGYARANFVSGTGPSSIGLYQLSAVATYGGATKTATTSFTVNN